MGVGALSFETFQCRAVDVKSSVGEGESWGMRTSAIFHSCVRWADSFPIRGVGEC